jgi:hypothetical protein
MRGSGATLTAVDRCPGNGDEGRRRGGAAVRHRIVLAALAALLALSLAGPAAARAEAPPHINHLFVIVLENENAEDTFGPVPPSPYLGTTLREAGAFIPNYFGIGHQSLDNYIALVSGQPPNLATQSDCLIYTEMMATSVPENGVATGQGCVYPRSVSTIGNQLERSGGTWRSYAQDMAAGAALGEATTCRHPTLGNYDTTQMASATNQYAARHVPFVYFHAVTDYETCNRNVVDLEDLNADLGSAATTPEYSFITPDLCADGHDATCADGTSPAGFAGIDAFLREWVPRIQVSPAYKDRGAILVTFDESETGAESCCNEPIGPNTLNNGGPQPGNGGGRVGAVLLSPCIKPGTVTQGAYNHFSTLLWTEDNFGLAPLGDAGAEGLSSFGTDVFSNPACTTGLGPPAREAARATAQSRLYVRPRRPLAGKRQAFRFRLTSTVAACVAGATIRFGGREATTNARGRAHLKLRLRHPGKRVVVAKAPGCPPSKAPVHAKRRRQH